ncbi:hypothetical protein ACQEVB_33160 [Pseudonocardia sp. CA-107938]|uniref:hypothetical protein n=1 Tax=Pseudonocardia sp. CA-107938 TaxID=3240021 RepID=UPI003D8A5083
MAARLDSAVRAAAAGLGACGAAALALPWWTAPPPVLLVPGVPVQAAEVRRGAEVVGLPGSVLLAVLAVAAVGAVAFAPSRVARPVLAAAGAGVAATGIAVLVGWGVTGAPGAWLAAAAGLLALAGAAGRPVLPWLAAAAVAATALAVVTADPAAQHDGPWIRLAAGTGRPVLVGGATAIASDTAVVVLDAHGHTRDLARPDVPGEILGLAGDRVARRIAADRLRVTSLRAADPVDLEIYAIAAVGPVGPDGTLWLRADGDPPGAVRVFDPGVYQGRQRLAATYLPVLSIGFPPGTVPVDPARSVPLADGGLRIVDRDGGPRLERIQPTPAAATVDVLAGGSDPACGLTGAARDAYLAGATTPPAPAPDGGIWLATADRLVRVDPAGTMRATAPPPGPVTAMIATPAGDVDVIVAGERAGLWRLPTAATTLVDLPPTPACTPHPPRAGPPVAFVPVGATGPEVGTALAVTGRWASQAHGDLAGVSGATRVPLGRRDGPLPVPVVPDGSGGVWWTERAGRGHVVAVHARPGAATERFPAVAAPDDAAPVPDLGGRAPLLASTTGLAAAAPGAAVPPVTGPVTGGVVRADGRGWFLADGRLVATAGSAVLGTLVDAGDRRSEPAPAAVQLARGVPPAQLALTGAHLALDASGRPVVVCSDGVVLRADPVTGAVTAIAQDPLLVAPTTVEGGIVQNTDGTLQRVDLPD